LNNVNGLGGFFGIGKRRVKFGSGQCTVIVFPAIAYIKIQIAIFNYFLKR
jgi:hypothetical protein